MTAAILVFALVIVGGTALQVEPPASSAAADTPKTVQARERLREGQRLMALDAFGDAAKAFESAIALDPLLFMAHYGLGTARMGLKEYAGAITAFEAARAAFHHPVSAGNRIETDKARQARIRHLQAQIAAAPLARGPSTATGVTNEGTQGNGRLADLRDLLNAQEEAQRLFELPPGLSLALGSAYFRTGRLEDAEREYRAAIVAEPKLGEPRSNLAVVLLITGRPEEARDQLALARKSGFNPPPGLESDIAKALARAR